MPVPYGWEHATNGSEATERLSAFGREQILKVAHIARQHVAAVAHTCGERGKEAIAYVGGLIIREQRLHGKAKLHLISKRALHGDGVDATSITDGEGARQEAVGRRLCCFEHIFVSAHLVGKLVV